MGAEGKREKKTIIPGTQSKARAGLPKRLRLVQAIREPFSPLSLLNCDQL